MKVAYLLSSVFAHDQLICEDARPPIASEYDWRPCYMDSLLADSYDVVVVDNRHHDLLELERLKSFMSTSPFSVFILRINDPFFHRQDPWFQFCFSLLDTPVFTS